MKKIIFHTGLPKTGTSSIQHFLMSHRGQLCRAGILFPSGPEDGRNTSGGNGLGQPPHADMFLHFYENNAVLAPSGIDWVSVFDEFRAEPDLTTMIVSFETQSVSARRLKVDAYRAAIKDSEAEFLTYIRNPLAWLNSLYIETTSSLYPFSGPPEALPAIKSYIAEGFSGMLAPFETLGTLHLRNYDAARANGRLLEDFLDAIGVSEVIPIPTEGLHQNTKAFRRGQLLVLRGLKKAQASQDEFLLCRNAMLDKNSKRGYPKSNDWIIPRQIAVQIHARWQEDRAIMAKRNGLLFPDAPLPEDLPNGMHLGAAAAEGLRAELDGVCSASLVNQAIAALG